MPHDHIQKIKFFTPSGSPRGWGPKKLCRCMCHSCEWFTHQIWLNFGKKFFLTPNPPRYPQVSPLGMTQVAEWKSRLICYISFICEKIHKVWFKNLWNWLCNSDLMIFDLLAPPQGPRGQGSKKWCHWATTNFWVPSSSFRVCNVSCYPWKCKRSMILINEKIRIST